MSRTERKYVKRVQAMFTAEQYDLLQEYAQEQDKPLGALVREAVEQYLIADLAQQRKRTALARLCSGDAPVNNWPEMERQIERRWEECWDE